MTILIDRIVAAQKRRDRYEQPAQRHPGRPPGYGGTRIGQKRRSELRRFEQDVERAAELGRQVASMKQDVDRLEQRHARLAELGDRHVEQAHCSLDYRYGIVIESQPIRSRKTGAELAVDVEPQLEHLRTEIAKAENEIKSWFPHDLPGKRETHGLGGHPAGPLSCTPRSHEGGGGVRPPVAVTPR